MASPTNKADPLGYDLDVDTDMQPDGRACSGARLVVNAVVHRHLADRLPLIGAPGGYVDFGRDVRKWPGDVTTEARAQLKGAELAMVIARDPRVDPGSVRVSVALQPSGAKYNMVITETFRTTTGVPISLVLGVSSVTVDLLAQGQ